MAISIWKIKTTDILVCHKTSYEEHGFYGNLNIPRKIQTFKIFNNKVASKKEACFMIYDVHNKYITNIIFDFCFLTKYSPRFLT